MRIERAPRRSRGPSLTSLIDVIFLLLLFFMLSSTFTRFAKVEITGGQAAASAEAETPDILLHLEGDAWKVNGIAMPVEEAMGELAGLQENGASSLAILVRGEETSQMLVEAVERIRRETGLSVSVAR